MEKHMEHLQQLKDFDENLAYEKEARAQELEQRKRVEVFWKLTQFELVVFQYQETLYGCSFFTSYLLRFIWSVDVSIRCAISLWDIWMTTLNNNDLIGKDF